PAGRTRTEIVASVPWTTCFGMKVKPIPAVRAEAAPAETASTAAAIAVRRAAVGIGIPLFKAWPHTLELVVRSFIARTSEGRIPWTRVEPSYGAQAAPPRPRRGPAAPAGPVCRKVLARQRRARLEHRLQAAEHIAPAARHALGRLRRVLEPVVHDGQLHDAVVCGLDLPADAGVRLLR